MDFLYFSAASTNGYDSLGHYLRAVFVLTSCTTYSTAPTPGCSANFEKPDATAASARVAKASAPKDAPTATTPPSALLQHDATTSSMHRDERGATVKRRDPDPPRLPAGRLMRRASPSIAANPVLIGAATTLVVLVAVFLAYNANNGLPFVPTYSLTADVPSAANLVPGNEIRIGGTRVGVVDEITPKRLASGQVIAQLHMKLETAVKPLPVDSTILVRSRSALGLKYVEITKGTSTKGYRRGRDDPAQGGDARARRVRRVPQHVRREDPQRPPRSSWRASATRSPAAARTSTRRSRRSTRCCSRSARRWPTSPTTAPSSAACRRRWAARRRSSPRSPRTRPRCSQPRHDVHRVRRDRAPLPARQRSAAGRRRCRPRSRSCPSSARSWPTARASSATCARASRRCRAPRRTSPTPSRSASRRCATRSRFNKRLVPTFARAAALRRGPAGRARRPGPRRHRADRQPAAGDARADPDGLQLLDAAASATPPRC